MCQRFPVRGAFITHGWPTQIDLQQKLAGRSGIVGTATALRGNVLHDNLVIEAKLLLQQRSPDDLALLTTADRGVDHWRWTPKFVAAVKAVRTGGLPLLLDRTDVVKELGSLFLDEPLTKVQPGQALWVPPLYSNVWPVLPSYCWAVTVVVCCWCTFAANCWAARPADQSLSAGHVLAPAFSSGRTTADERCAESTGG